MPFFQLQALVERTYGPALLLRRVFPHEQRIAVERMLTFTTILFLALAVFAYTIQASSLGAMPGFSAASAFGNKLYGLFLIIFSFKFLMTAIEAFHRSYYFHGLDQVLAEAFPGTPTSVSFEVGTIVDETEAADVTRAFLDSSYGQEILYRVGIDSDTFTKYFVTRAPSLTADNFVIEDSAAITLPVYARALFAADHDLRTWLQAHNINEKDFVDSAEWVMRLERTQRQRERWWSKDNLGRVPGLGKTWNYGEHFLLDKYGHEMTEDPVWESAMMTALAVDSEVESLETILARNRQSNALLIGAEGSGKRERVAQLYHKVREGKVLPQIEHKLVYLIDIEAVVTVTNNKQAFENEVRKVMNEAVHAGNIILYVEHIASAIASASAFGADLVDVLTPYFESSALQLIVSSDEESFHRHLSRDGRFMQYFEVVRMHDIDQSGLMNVLEQRAVMLEDKTKVAFTIQALHAVARDANRYFPDGVMPDKALDLLEELVPVVQQQKRTLVTVEDVETHVSSKTGVPLGTPSPEERDKLLSLEDFLHKRVVGQESAVGAVARALRRARAGVGSSERPMGSFLFLGPTGVGKTETAKALAQALFGRDDVMMRLDMSEYKGEDALDRLIGSFETGEPGRLSVMLREKQFGVLLLDEFEKSDRTVHDLFLQVLDEGQFSDAAGKKVNARNLIIIATSNAGADVIWNWSKEGKDVVALKRTLVDKLIGDGLFRPEFLNRFDDIILFHPLSENDIAAIARIQLENLARRLEDKGIRLAVTEELIAAIAKEGYDPQFGGRPMNRAIKDKVEQAVADRILQGKLQPGEKIVLGVEDL